MEEYKNSKKFYANKNTTQGSISFVYFVIYNRFFVILIFYIYYMYINN